MRKVKLTNGISRNEPHQVIVHAMGEYIQTRRKRYFAPEYLQFDGTSAHIFVLPSGELIRGREDLEGAFHAKGFNVDTLGIEFLVEGVHNYETFLRRIKEPWVIEEQFEAGARQVATWVRKFSIQSVLRHSDISPERKLDPGTGFNWLAFVERVRELTGVQVYEQE